MNKQMIRYVLGLVLLIEGALLLLPLAVALLYREASWIYFIATIGVCLALGGCMTLRKPQRRALFPKDGFVIAALSWIVISLVGALPFCLSGQIPRYIDALFEMISGFTTTGSSILTQVEALDHGMLFWRSFSHWVGGMGILVFMLALLPAMGGATIHILRAESPGPSVGKVVPKIRDSAKITYEIYLALTVLLVILYLAGGMSLFDSLCIAFGTAGTGGFAVRTSSCSEYSPYIQTVTTIFMILFGVNFTVYFLLLQRKFRQALRSSELWTYLGVILVATLAISLNIFRSMSSFGQAVHHAAFTVSSLITTTGYGTVDFNLWPEFSRVILCFLMVMGACAGSTGGGFKVSRIVILCRYANNELKRLIHRWTANRSPGKRCTACWSTPSSTSSLPWPPCSSSLWTISTPPPPSPLSWPPSITSAPAWAPWDRRLPLPGCRTCPKPSCAWTCWPDDWRSSPSWCFSCPAPGPKNKTGVHAPIVTMICSPYRRQ